MNNIYINLLKKSILPDLKKSRGGFDLNHTKAVVIKLDDILTNEKQLRNTIDYPVLTIAAYAHDWGYSANTISSVNPTYGSINFIKAKELHMDVGAKKLKQLLKMPEFDFLTIQQKTRAVHLVKVHDRLDRLKDVDELILMEADTLGALDTKLVKPTFDKLGAEKYLTSVKTNRLPKFITTYGKSELPRVLSLFKNYYN